MSEIQNEIDAKTKEIDTLLGEAEIQIHVFIKATAAAIKQQALHIAKYLGKSQPDVSARLGKSGLETIVKEVAEYAEKADETCRKCIYKKTAWRTLAWKDTERDQWHPRSQVYVSGVPADAKEQAHHVIDALIPLGAILENHRFKTCKDYSHSPYAIPNDLVCNLFKWSPDMETAFKKYHEIETSVSAVQRTINELAAKKLKMEASSLWDEVS